MKYRVSLINNAGCQFDSGIFSSMADAKDFARGRGGDYSVIINTDIYQAKNGRIAWSNPMPWED